MKNKTTHIQLVTNASALAALVVASRYVKKTFFPWGTPATTFLGVLTEINLYIIAITTIYFVYKFGKKRGFLTALAGAFIASVVSWVLGLLPIKSILTLPLCFMIPWMAMALVAFATKDSSPLKTILVSALINVIIISFWSICVIFDYKYTFKAGFIWHLITYHGWTLFVTIPIITLVMNKRFKKIPIK